MSSGYWEYTVHEEPFDALVIGSGFVGSWTAFHLKELRPHWRIGLVERSVFGAGASSRNAGFACFGSPTELLDDLSREDEARVWNRVERRWKGLLRWKEVFSESDLSWESLGGHELFLPEEGFIWHDTLEQLESLNASMARITGNEKVFQQSQNLPGAHWLGGIHNALEAQLHPGKALQKLHERCWTLGVVPLFGCSVAPFSEWNQTTAGWEVRTQRGVLRARCVSVSTNGTTGAIFPDAPVVPARGQILLTHPLEPAQLPYRGTYHADAGYLYFRNVGNRLLLGGARNHFREAEQTDSQENTEDVVNHLTRYLKEVLLPGIFVEIDQTWAGTMGFGPQQEKDPWVVEVQPGIWSGVRLGGMGVAIAPLLGEELAEKLTQSH